MSSEPHPKKQERHKGNQNLSKVSSSSSSSLPPSLTLNQQRQKNDQQQQPEIVLSLLRLDPVIQFITKATGRPLIDLRTLKSTLPSSFCNKESFKHWIELYQRGIIHITTKNCNKNHRDDVANISSTEASANASETSPITIITAENLSDDNKNSNIFIGYPPPKQISTSNDDQHYDDIHENFHENDNNGIRKKKKSIKSKPSNNGGGTLHGSTKAAAKRRLAALKRSLKLNPQLKLPSQQEQQKQEEKVQHENNYDETIEKSVITPDEQQSSKNNNHATITPSPTCFKNDKEEDSSNAQTTKIWENMPLQSSPLLLRKRKDDDVIIAEDEKVARDALHKFFMKNEESCILPYQAAYATSYAGQRPSYGDLPIGIQTKIPSCLMNAFGFAHDVKKTYKNSSAASYNDTPKNNRSCSTIPQSFAKKRLYRHQADAIESAIRGIHTLVCTGTGSGKSLCFLLPVLAAAMSSKYSSSQDESEGISNISSCSASIIMFPTKALAQDQYTKIDHMVREHQDLEGHIRVGVIDGDTPHSLRDYVSKNCNVILTNPDTLHAAILPGWKGTYRPILQRLKYVVIDEAHIYDGVFGAHVAFVLSRLLRICVVASMSSNNTRAVGNDDNCNGKKHGTLSLPTFLACSATMSHPEHHFRMLCPISSSSKVKIIRPEDDASPRQPKHFFVWNPPIMNTNGECTGQVVTKNTKCNKKKDENIASSCKHIKKRKRNKLTNTGESKTEEEKNGSTTDRTRDKEFYRRHAADETAMLLANAVKNKIRCIAFCKTRSLVEWVYERTISNLQSDPTTSHLASMVESYRGGYTKEARRGIEQRLFRNSLLAVVGTSALELGVDIGGIDLTLHCGYPSSKSSLLQQAGRAGRGNHDASCPSLAVVVCFNSASEQHMWRNPKCLLSDGRSIPQSFPINVGLVRAHLLCAGSEYPLTGELPVSTFFEIEDSINEVLNDHSLLGSAGLYEEAIQGLVANGALQRDTPFCIVKGGHIAVHKTHPSIQKPWSQVSLRSIEPVNYSIVDVTHPLQGGSMDKIHDEKAVLDTIPYSRVFYHAFPGSIIMHRGRKYKVKAMTRPPPAIMSYAGYKNQNLAAFAAPTAARYSTRPLSTLSITVVKQIERVDIRNGINNLDDEVSPCSKPVTQPTTSEVHSADNGHCDNSLDIKLLEANSELACECESVAGNGTVTVKRSVHGYKKLSLVTRVELSRTEISLPSMEFDTYAMWLDTEADNLKCILPSYDDGVHALSHALLAVAPLFVPCTSSDIDCDHQVFKCTRVMIFDVRAGGNGTTAALWKYLFRPNGLLDAAIELLENCSSCHSDEGYQGGCPACIQLGQCIKFNQNLCRSTGLIIARRILTRLKQSDIYQGSCHYSAPSLKKYDECCLQTKNSTPRRKARAKALHDAKDLTEARSRSVVVGRPTWAFDLATGGGIKEINVD